MSIKMLPLTVTRSGENVNICSLACTCDEARRLRELGCVEGISACIISNQSNVIIQIGNSRLAIDGKLARSILVNPN